MLAKEGVLWSKGVLSAPRVSAAASASAIKVLWPALLHQAMASSAL